jgi:hypothetical protein
MQRVYAAIAAFGVVRRRGGYGNADRDNPNPQFAASVTIDKMLSRGQLVPGASWGTYTTPERAKHG